MNLASRCLVVSLVLVALGLRPGSLPVGAVEESPVVREVVFDSTSGLGHGWADLGWAPREVHAGSPVVLRLTKGAGWIVAHPGSALRLGGLRFRVSAATAAETFLEVELDGAGATRLPRVALDSRHRSGQLGEWIEFTIPARELNPSGVAFDRIVFRATAVADEVRLDAIGLLDAPVRAGRDGGIDPASSSVAAGPVKLVTFALDCKALGHPISPFIYGIAYNPRLDAGHRHQWLLGATARRWGGNPSSRYNFDLGNAWNTANDWFFRNVNYTSDPHFTWRSFFDANAAQGVATALTVPTLGWVAKDTTSYSFPVSTFGRQRDSAPENPDVGNGLGLDGRPLAPGPPTRTSIACSAQDVGRWVRAIREYDVATSRRSVDLYILDNEPMLWNDTHRDVHPEPVTYDELLQRTVAYGSAVRAADPQARIAGPALWGWPAYFNSAADEVGGVFRKADRAAHGGTPLLAWWLRKLHEHEQRTGVRLVDVVDAHFYPQGRGISGSSAATDPSTAGRRIRSTRGLWDPSYVDESWIGESMAVVPLIKQWIRENDPGLGISIGEWNFGAEAHMSGGLATAEALGRFGSLGVFSAFYWDYPVDRSPAFWAFRAFRNFDGQGAHFEDQSLPTTGSGSHASLFASRSQDGTNVVAILLNFETHASLDARLDMGTCADFSSQRAFSYAGGPDGFIYREPARLANGTAELVVPPYSITVLELKVSPRPPER